MTKLLLLFYKGPTIIKKHCLYNKKIIKLDLEKLFGLGVETLDGKVKELKDMTNYYISEKKFGEEYFKGLEGLLNEYDK